ACERDACQIVVAMVIADVRHRALLDADTRVPRTARAIGARHGEFAVVRGVAVADEQNTILPAIFDDDVVDVHARHARTVDAADVRALAVVRAASHRYLAGARGDADQGHGDGRRTCLDRGAGS